MSEPYYEGISKVIILNTGDGKFFCQECNRFDSPTNSFQEIINHHLEHGYKLLHIGTEGSNKGDYTYFETVAYLGR